MADAALTYFKPSTPLTPYIDAYWILCSPTPLQQLILPSASLDIILNPGEPIIPLQHHAKVLELSTAYVIGCQNQSAWIQLPSAACMMGIRFKPGGAYPFLQIPLHEFTDRSISLDTIPGFRELHMQFLYSNSPAEMIRRTDQLLQKQLADLAPADLLVQEVVRLLQNNPKYPGLGWLEKAFAISGRQLQRRFNIQIGIAPHPFFRMVRFQKTAIRLAKKSDITPADTAYNLRYYDQSHMNREFKSFSCITPLQYQAHLVENIQYSAGKLSYPEQ